VKKLFLFSISIILFTSCLDGTVDISLNKDLSGSIQAAYTIAGETQYISSDLVDMKYQYLPLDGAYLKQISDTNEGLSLDSYKKTETGKFVTINMLFHFSTLAEVEKFSGYKNGVKIMSLAGSVPGLIKLTLTNPMNSEISAKTLNLLDDLYADKTIKLSLKVSGFITNTDRGGLAPDPSVAVLTIPVMQLLHAKKPVVWTVTYK